MEKEKTTVQLSVRVTESLHQRLAAEANIQNRPLANYIKAILIDHIDSLDRVKKIAENR